MVYAFSALPSFGTWYTHLDTTRRVFSFIVQSSRVDIVVRIESLQSLVFMSCVWNPFSSILAPAGPAMQFSRSIRLPYGENDKCMHSVSTRNGTLALDS